MGRIDTSGRPGLDGQDGRDGDDGNPGRLLKNGGRGKGGNGKRGRAGSAGTRGENAGDVRIRLESSGNRVIAIGTGGTTLIDADGLIVHAAGGRGGDGGSGGSGGLGGSGNPSGMPGAPGSGGNGADGGDGGKVEISATDALLLAVVSEVVVEGGAGGVGGAGDPPGRHGRDGRDGEFWLVARHGSDHERDTRFGVRVERPVLELGPSALGECVPPAALLELRGARLVNVGAISVPAPLELAAWFEDLPQEVARLSHRGESVPPNGSITVSGSAGLRVPDHFRLGRHDVVVSCFGTRAGRTLDLSRAEVARVPVTVHHRLDVSSILEALGETTEFDVALVTAIRDRLDPLPPEQQLGETAGRALARLLGHLRGDEQASALRVDELDQALAMSTVDRSVARQAVMAALPSPLPGDLALLVAADVWRRAEPADLHRLMDALHFAALAGGVLRPQEHASLLEFASRTGLDEAWLREHLPRLAAEPGATPERDEWNSAAAGRLPLIAMLPVAFLTGTSPSAAGVLFTSTCCYVATGLLLERLSFRKACGQCESTDVVPADQHWRCRNCGARSGTDVSHPRALLHVNSPYRGEVPIDERLGARLAALGRRLDRPRWIALARSFDAAGMALAFAAVITLVIRAALLGASSWALLLAAGTMTALARASDASREVRFRPVRPVLAAVLVGMLISAVEFTWTSRGGPSEVAGTNPAEHRP